jgi:hypothetical protein
MRIIKRMRFTPIRSAGGLGFWSDELLRGIPQLRVAALLLLTLTSFVIPHEAFAAAPESQVFLEQYCYECHNGGSPN